jgi:hypothetical protein
MAIAGTQTGGAQHVLVILDTSQLQKNIWLQKKNKY